MATYAAVISLDYYITNIIKNCGVLLSQRSPLLVEMLEIVNKELKSFAQFLDTLDGNSRMKMNDSLQRIAHATIEFHCSFMSLLDKLQYAEGIFQEQGYIEDFKQETLSFVDAFKKIVEECLRQVIHFPNQHQAVVSKFQMVGLCDIYTNLKKNIFYAFLGEPVFLIVGMAGIGKTALAKKLFEDLDVLEWFDCRVWVTIGRKYQREEIDRTIHAQLDIDVPGCLKESLMGKRYLIVLDDVWDMELVNHYLETSFPITRNRSRVLITSRIRYDMPFNYFIISTQLLNKQESWHLLREKIFGQGSCPDELEEAGKQIAEKCDGLPLMIITVADLLSKAEKTPGSLWIEVSSHKKHQLFIDAYNEISKVLYPSYDNLPEDLKLSFLYMGVFPHSYKISQSKLINLWIVEKLINKDSFPSLEINGMNHLKYFSLHHIVMVYEASTLFYDRDDHRIKTCGLHSSWWHFCYREARKNEFFHVLDSVTDASGEVIKGQSRLAIHNNVLFGIKVVHKSIEENCAATTHSLLCFGPYHQYPVPTCIGLKLLKKLDALNIRFYEFPLEVLELVKLRYLALTCNASLPPTISKLRKLQYLIVHRHLNIKFEVMSYFPVEIWNMKRLKHLHVTGNDLPDVAGTFLSNLCTLVDVSSKSCTNGVLRRIPYLKKLGIRIDLMPDAVEPLCCFDHVANLSELESLTCVIENPIYNLEVVIPFVPLSTFPLNLKKLHLSGLGCSWERMSMISSLPNLEILKLRSNAFRGPIWIIEEDEFPKLSCLILEDMDLVVLKGRNESFKCLKRVSIQHCYNLRKLRWRNNYKLTTNIKVVDCNPLVRMEIQKSLLSSANATAVKPFSIRSSWIS